MSTNSSNSKRRDAAHERGSSQPRAGLNSEELRSAEDELNQNNGFTEHAVKTFEFEVGAGRPTLRDRPGSSTAASPSARRVTTQSTDEPSRVERVADATNKTEVQPAIAIPVAIELPNVIAYGEEEASPTLADRPPPRASRHSSWWMTSLGIHVLALFALAFTTLAVMEEEEIDLYASPVVYETVDEFQDLEIDPTEDLESLEEELGDALSELEADSFADLTNEPLTDEPATIADTASTVVTGDLSDLGQLFGEPASGSGNGMPSGKAMAKFFGTEISARKILYMLDNSGGMNSGGKFEALVTELKRSVSALGPKQKFYVIFYSDTVYSLYYPQSVRKFMAPTDRNRKRLDRWLDTVELCYGNAIDEAIAAAEVIQPDAVFLLTDGNLFTTKKKEAILLNRAGRRYPIYTFGLGVGETTKTADKLRLVAEANGGTFKSIKVSAEIRELAKQRARVYNRDKPGLVWGLKVKTR